MLYIEDGPHPRSLDPYPARAMEQHPPTRAEHRAFAEQGRNEFARERESFEWVVLVAEAASR